MRKIIYILTFLLSVSFVSQAQLATNRTSETKIADALAKQPSDNSDKMNEVMKDLEGFTQEDFSLLLQGLKPQGEKNEKTEYLTNSYSFYVLQPGKENLRATFIAGLIDALDKIQDPNNKGFVFRMLVQAAKEEAIDAVAPYLLSEDQGLVEKAARVLNRIGGEKSAAVLNHALVEVSEASSVIAIVSALGDIEASEAEENIIAQLDKYENPEVNKAVFFALSKIGGTKSQKVWLKKLKETGYQYENNNIAGAAIRYATVLHHKNQGQAVKFVNKIYKGASKAGQYQAQIAALNLLNKWEPRKTTSKMVKAVNSDNAEMRAIGLASLAKNYSQTAKILKSLPKFSPEKQESVLLFYANNGTPADLATLKPLVKSDNQRVRFAALEAVHKISNQSETQFLIDNLGVSAEQDAFIKNLLLSSKAVDALEIINSNLKDSENEAVNEVLLDVLAVRSNDDSFDAVYPLTKSSHASVRKKAFQALSNVSSTNQLPELFGRVSELSGEELTHSQQAIVSSLEYSAQKDQEIKNISSKISKSSAPSAAKYFPIFSGLGGEEALRAVSNYTHSPSPELKTEAFKALANWKDAESLPVLLKLYKENLSDADFEIVFKGLISQINKSEEPLEQKGLYLRDAFDYARTVQQKRLALGAMQSTESYQALIFAGKFLDDKDLKGAATTVAMNIGTENPQYYGADVRRILEKVSANLSDGGNESSYLNEAVVRHLKEMPQGEGYVSLFNGKDLTGWKGLVENPIKRKNMSAEELAEKQKKADEIMRAGWVVENGELVFVGKGDNIATVKDYGDFEMLVDWKLDKDGEEPDAGVYLRGTPQVQIWDISRTNVGAQVGSGGLYNNQKYETDPIKVADNPLGEWNTFKIRMIGEKVSVWLNGELVTDEVPLENYWDRNQSIFPKEQIELQAHGSKVYYRDVYLKELGGKEVFELSEEEKEEGFTMLFDGTHLDHWQGSKSYSINDNGELWINPDVKPGNTGSNFYTKDEYGDFVFRFEFKLTEGANNGVGIRAPLSGDVAYGGMEIQILDDEADIYRNLKEFQYHGSVYGVVPAKKGSLKPVGEWNEEEIRIQGNKIKVTVNGQVIVDADLQEASENGTLDGKDHPGLKRTTGHIAFLGHGDVVYFRNIRVKSL